MCVRSPQPVIARIHRKRIGASSGTMYHTIKHSSVKHSLRYISCIKCAVSGHLSALHHTCYMFYACRVAAGYATPAVRHQKETRNACACQAFQRDVWRALDKKKDSGFCELWVKPLRQPSASVLVNMGASTSTVGVRSSGVIGVSGDTPPGVWSGWTQGIEEGT